MSAYEIVIDALRGVGSTVNDNGSKATAQCPAHDDRNPSLSVKQREDGSGVVVHCFAGCDYTDVLNALGLFPRDLYDDPAMRKARSPEANYRYPSGKVKTRQPKPGGGKTTKWPRGGVGDGLYLSDKIPADCPLVILNEGEPAAQAAWAVGAVGVASGGATRFCNVEPLRGRSVWAVVDRDEAGIAWAKRYSALLEGVADEVRWVRTPLDIPKADLCDHLDNGLTLQQLEQFDPFSTSYEANSGDDTFWDQRAVLKHIRAFARSRRVAPYAVLACELRRAISCVPPNVKLPPLIGGATSVNLFTVTVGRSGQGKGAADAAGFAAIYFHDANAEDLDAPRPSIGSGEGLARLFKGHDQDALTRAHMTVPEISTLAALAGRQGATIAGELLKAYMGEALGFSNASRSTTTAVEDHSYRLCLGIGAQPENANFFFDREKDGFPQRFLWVSTLDVDAPRTPPGSVARLDVLIPSFGSDEHQIAVPESVAAEIDEHRYLTLIGSPDAEPLDGHLMLTRLKVAFGLALLDGRGGIREDDWNLAGELIAVSTQVRSDARAAVEERRRRANQARAYEQAERDQIVAEKLAEGEQRRVWRSVEGKLLKVGKASRRDLRHALHSSVRRELDPVLEIMSDLGKLTITPGGSRDSDEFGLGGG